MRIVLAILVIALSWASGAQANSPIATVVAQIDPAQLLAPPPPRGSAQEKVELDELRRIVATRTTEDLVHATWDDEHENPTAFAGVMAPTYDLGDLPQTTKLLGQVQDTADAVATLAKRHFMRLRAYQIDHTINGCAAGADAPYSSYPSGHATIGWALATVLADLAPEKAEALMARADDFAHSRMLCGSHFSSDVAASKILGRVVAGDVLADPELKPEIEAARAEMARARAAFARSSPPAPPR